MNISITAEKIDNSIPVSPLTLSVETDDITLVRERGGKGLIFEQDMDGGILKSTTTTEDRDAILALATDESLHSLAALKVDGIGNPETILVATSRVVRATETASGTRLEIKKLPTNMVVETSEDIATYASRFNTISLGAHELVSVTGKVENHEKDSVVYINKENVDVFKYDLVADSSNVITGTHGYERSRKLRIAGNYASL